MGEKPLVSVVIPTLNNRPEELKRAVNSILNQTYKNFEILIINQGPRIKGFNVKIINQKKGLALARKTGIEKSKGEFIAFLDDDDTWFNTHLEKSIDFFQQNKEISVLFTPGIIISESKKTIKKKQQMEKNSKNYIKNMSKIKINNGYYLKNYFEYLIKNGSTFAMSSIIIKKTALEKIKPDENIAFFSEDYDLWLRLAKHFKIGFINKPHCTYYLREKGGYHFDLSNNEKISNSQLYIYNKLLKTEKLNQNQINLIKKQISKVYFELGYSYYVFDYFRKAKKQYLKSLKRKLNYKAIKGLIKIIFIPKKVLIKHNKKSRLELR